MDRALVDRIITGLDQVMGMIPSPEKCGCARRKLEGATTFKVWLLRRAHADEEADAVQAWADIRIGRLRRIEAGLDPDEPAPTLPHPGVVTVLDHQEEDADVVSV